MMHHLLWSRRLPTPKRNPFSYLLVETQVNPRIRHTSQPLKLLQPLNSVSLLSFLQWIEVLSFQHLSTVQVLTHAALLLVHGHVTPVSIVVGLANPLNDMPAIVVPSLSHDLVSINSVVNDGGYALFDNSSVIAFKSNDLLDNLVSNLKDHPSIPSSLIFLGHRQPSGLYHIDIDQPSPVAHQATTISTIRCPTIKSIVEEYFRILGYPSCNSFCNLVQSQSIIELPPQLTATAVTKWYPYNNSIRAVSTMAQRSTARPQSHTPTQYSFCGESVQIDILNIWHLFNNWPPAIGNFKHAIIIKDLYSKYVHYILIKSMDRLYSHFPTICQFYSDCNHPIQHIQFDSQFHSPEAHAFLSKQHVKYTISPPPLMNINFKELLSVQIVLFKIGCNLPLQHLQQNVKPSGDTLWQTAFIK